MRRELSGAATGLDALGSAKRPGSNQFAAHAEDLRGRPGHRCKGCVPRETVRDGVAGELKYKPRLMGVDRAGRWRDGERNAGAMEENAPIVVRVIVTP